MVFKFHVYNAVILWCENARAIRLLCPPARVQFETSHVPLAALHIHDCDLVCTRMYPNCVQELLRLVLILSITVRSCHQLISWQTIQKLRFRTVWQVHASSQ